MDQFFTWESLGTMAGSSMITFLIVQYTKKLLDSKFQLPTDVYTVIVAFVFLLLPQLAMGANGYDWRLYVLTFTNSFLVAAGASHINNKALNPPNVKQKNEGDNNAKL